MSRGAGAGAARGKETRGRGASKRRAGREMALQMLYQREMGGVTTPQVLHHYNPVDLLEAVRDEPQEDTLVAISGQPTQMREALAYAHRLVAGAADHLGELDELIREQAEHWRLERMSVVDRNVLRLAVYELIYEPDVPKLVVLDEAIELAKRFGSEQSGRFVNGLLDGLLRSHRFPGSMT
ncbi:MAG TPA: transcription antitermination factor NusB [Thermoanaerobaculia bacterium]|nr:transcription antitermination factor NusB [Thermoanaerobaculia bacterium]HXT52083.1 transcription antitermination factor NusB [Thermoanaerobaculia bacterium]